MCPFVLTSPAIFVTPVPVMLLARLPAVKSNVPPLLAPSVTFKSSAAIFNLAPDAIVKAFCVKLPVTVVVPVLIVVKPLEPVPAESAIELILFVPVKVTPFPVVAPSLIIPDVKVEPEMLTAPPAVLSIPAPENPPNPPTSVRFSV